MEITRNILGFIELFYIIYLMIYAFMLALSVIIGSVSIYESRRRRVLKNTFSVDKKIKISIIVPAHNEETTILDTIESLVNLEYLDYEIIVVSDGSTDDTVKNIITKYKLSQVDKYIVNKIDTMPIRKIYEGKYRGIPVMIVDKEKGGKADSLNTGINVANNQWFICMDADSILQSDALKEVILPILEEDNVIASSGAIMIGNGVKIEKGKVKKHDMPRNLLASMQVVEYNRTFLASRIMFDKTNSNLIISGAFGLFNRDIVIAAGGYDYSTRGEDMELVMKLHTFCKVNNRKYKIKYNPNAICWTQAPETLKDLITQRKRWHIGLYECMSKYKSVFLNRNHDPMGILAYIYFLLYEFLSPYIEVIGVFATILLYIVGLINIDFMIAFYIFYTTLGVLFSLVAFCSTIYMNEMQFNFRKLFKVLILCFFEIGFLRFVLTWVRFVSLIGYDKNKYSWGAISRKEMGKA